MMINLRLFDRNGTTLLGALPTPMSYQIGFEFSDVGAIRFEYPTSGINANLLTEWREVGIFDENGNEYTNARFVITGIDRERTETTGTIRVTGRSILWRLDTALTYPTGGLGAGTIRNFTGAKVGAILKTLIDDAKTRGALSGITYSFSATTDSNSASWVDNVTQEYPARTTLLSVLRGLTELGLVEVQTDARVLKATKPDGIGTDKTTGSNPVVLRYGYNVTEAPETVDASEIAGVVLVEGDNGLILERSNATTTSTFGRIETALTVSGVSDGTVAGGLADSFLTTVADADRQLTVGLTLQDGAPQPLTDFKVGDYVYTATNAGLERVRIRTISVSMSNGVLSATATLGDRIFENDIKVARKISAITSGALGLGNGTLPVEPSDPVEDTIAPAAPTSVTGTTSAYLDGSTPRARVVLTWTAPTLNSDGSTLDDLREYNVYIRRLVGDAWEFAGTVTSTTATLSGLTPSTSYRYTVAAVDSSNNQSALATEFVQTSASGGTIPFSTTPSTPTVTSRLGTLSVAWNGLNNVGAAMPAGFSHVEVHTSTSSGFTPTSGTYKGRMNGADTLILSDLSYNTTYYIKFVPVSTAGVAGAASAQAAASIQPLVDTDIIANTISGAKIASGTITASDKIIANTITGGLIQALAISADKIQANAITADKIEAGAITAVKIAAGAITTDKLTAGTLTGFTINNGNGTFTVNSAGDVTATSGVIGGFTLSNGSLFSGNLTLSSNGTIQGGNASTLFYGFVNIGGGFPTGERLIVTGSSSFVGSIIATGNVTSQTHFFIPFANNVTSAANGFVVGLPGGSGRMTYTTASSARYKHDITPLRDVPEMDPKKLLDLPVRAFRYNSDYVSPTDDRAEVLMPGFIAEEVDAVYPIAADYDGGMVNSWNERMIVPGMLALIQDLTQELADIKATLNGESA